MANEQTYKSGADQGSTPKGIKGPGKNDKGPKVFKLEGTTKGFKAPFEQP